MIDDKHGEQETDPVKLKEMQDLEKAKADARASKIKAMDVTIDSLKQYITLSTVAIGAMLAYYNGMGKDGSHDWLFRGLGFFVFCILTSVITINSFINKAHRDEIDVRKPVHRILNALAIVLFFAGLFSGGKFFLSNQNEEVKQTNAKLPVKTNLSKIVVDKQIKANVEVRRDTASGDVTVVVTPK